MSILIAFFIALISNNSFSMNEEKVDEFLYIELPNLEHFELARKQIENNYKNRTFNIDLKNYISHSDDELRIYIYLSLGNYLKLVRPMMKSYFMKDFMYYDDTETQHEVALKSSKPHLRYYQKVKSEIDKLQLENNNNEDTFDKIKKIISEIPLYKNEDYCFNSAKLVNALLTSGNRSIKKTSINNADFFKKDENNNYLDHIVKKLFEQPLENEHLVFYFKLHKEMHAFILEKVKINGVWTWNVYQSCSGLYSILEWMDGIEKKQLLRDEIEDFLNNTIKFYTKFSEVGYNNLRLINISLRNANPLWLQKINIGIDLEPQNTQD